MRIIFLIAIFSISASCASAQPENPVYKKTADSLVFYYNSGGYASIFNMFSKGMKTAVPLDKLTDYFTRIKQRWGAILKRKFLYYDSRNGRTVINQMDFEKTVTGMQLTVDNEGLITGMYFNPLTPPKVLPPVPERNSTLLVLPFTDEWTVFWGGDTKEDNYHSEYRAQKNAFDFVIKDSKGRTYKTNGKTNEDYYAFGKKLFAPCDAIVVAVVTGIKDCTPGERNTLFSGGNTVVLKTANEEFLVLHHFKNESIVVKEKQLVKQGDLLGLCGNSGNSTEPHLHFHLQNMEEMRDASGIKAYFNKLMVNGELKTDYSPVRNDKISVAQ